jgi:hypothetical protein
LSTFSQKVGDDCCYLATTIPVLRRALATAVAIEPTIRQNPSAFVQKAL